MTMSFPDFVILIITAIISVLCIPVSATCIGKHDVGSGSSTVFHLDSQIGAPVCYAQMRVRPSIACQNGTNFFQINSSLSNGDDEEVTINCSADYPIDLKFDGLFFRHPSLKVLFDRRINPAEEQMFFLNLSFPAEVISNGDYIIFSLYNLSVETKIEMKLTPKHPAGSGHSANIDIFNSRPTLTNVTDKLLTLDVRVHQDNKRLFMVCASEFENNVQRLVNVYARNPTEATYKSECLFKNYRCFTKREGSLVQCRTYGLSNYSCRSLDLKPPGGFVSCFTEGYAINYSITKKYFVGVDNQYYFKEEGDEVDNLSSDKVISITKAEYNPWSGQPYEFSCKISTYLLAREISWYLLSEQNSWKQLTNANHTEDKKSAVMTSTVNIVFNSLPKAKKVSVVCTGYHYKSPHTFNSTVEVNVIESFAPVFYPSAKKEVHEFDEQGYFILECKAFGIPPPTLEWVKAGTNISGTAVETVKGFNYTESFLKFSKINEDTPLGDIKCVAANRLSSASKDFVTRIKDDPSNGIYWKLFGVSLGISIAAAVILIYLYIHFKRKTAALTKAEIDAFKKGNPHPVNPDEANVIPQNIPYNEEFEINEKKLVYDETNPENVLGSGAFGLVLKGVYNDEAVAIKTLKPYSSKSELQSLLCELKVMQYIGEHPNIAKLIGASTKNLHLGKALVILELYSLGSLENYLKKFRGSFVNQMYCNELSPTAESNYKNIALISEEVIFTRDLINWSCQIADGMAHLSEISVIHGDLATRNILLADKNTIKIADFGLSRKQYADFYAKQSQEPVPWRWMALESLRYLIFSVESDVWAYGIMLWEIFTLAEVPYSGLNWSEEFKDSLARGMRLPKPVYAPKELYDVMCQCWLEIPKQRINFEKIKHSLQVLLTKFMDG